MRVRHAARGKRRCVAMQARKKALCLLPARVYRCSVRAGAACAVCARALPYERRESGAPPGVAQAAESLHFHPA